MADFRPIAGGLGDRWDLWPEGENRLRTSAFELSSPAADNLEKLYRQRVYRITQLGDNTFESKVYTFEKPLEFAGPWREDNPLTGLTLSDLTAREGCSIILRWIGDGFEGSTLGRLCKSSLRGATFATSEFVITPDKVVSWDRGFDDAGQHIWGAEKSGYVFVRENTR